jgi:F0F1-type ATP synthase beta subunit
MILNGELDDVPEQAFMMCGQIEDVLAAAEEMRD